MHAPNLTNFLVFLSFNADQTLQMESPSAQDRLIEAQEDFTSAGSSSEATTSASTEEPSTTAESTERSDEDVGSLTTAAEEDMRDVVVVGESIENEDTFVNVESCEASLASLETSNDSSAGEGQLDFSDMGLKLGKNEKRSEDEDVDANVEVKSNESIEVEQQDCLEATSTTICTTSQTTASTTSMSSSATLSPSPPSMVQCVSEKQTTEYCKTSDGEFVTSSPICRKRPATDFLPINAEIKRIGVEMPENESNQVRRISPVLVSLRERTLGEISLSSDSCLFDSEVGSRCVPRNNRILDDLLTSTNCRLSTSLDDSFQASDHDTEATDCTDTAERRMCRVATSLEGECTSGSVEEALAEQGEKLEYPDPFIDEDSCCSLSRDSPERNLKKCEEPKQCEEPIDDECSCNDTMPAGDACAVTRDETSNELIKNSLPNLIVKVEQIDLSRYLAAERKDKSKRMVIVPKRKQKKTSEECKDDAGNVDVRTDPKESLQCFVPLCTYTSESDEKTESQDQEKQVDSVLVSTAREKLESSFTSTPIKECKVLLQRITLPKTARTMTTIQQQALEETAAPRAIIEKLAEDEEVVFSFPLPSTANLQTLSNLDPIEATRPTSPEELLESTADVAEAIDTETETETGSDSSEMSSMTNVRLGGCDDDAASDQISCQESESICCVDINPEIISRLEPERPEPFTEDSAESLALATGARDEVRSDGSDSGLGSEIPGDPGPAPVPESDSETSFLDRIPDDILSDKEKGNRTIQFSSPFLRSQITFVKVQQHHDNFCPQARRKYDDVLFQQ